MNEYEVTLTIPHIEGKSPKEAIEQFKQEVDKEDWIYMVKNSQTGEIIEVDSAEFFFEDYG